MEHTGLAGLGARVRPGWFVQTHEHPELLSRSLLEVLHRGDGRSGGRAGMGREQASRVLDRYELSASAEQRFESLSGGQQARFQILLLELSGATLLLLDEPTDNLDVTSAEALEAGLAAFEGTVLAVTHDRWFARGFTGSSSTAPTATSSSPASRCGTRRVCAERGDPRRPSAPARRVAPPTPWGRRPARRAEQRRTQLAAMPSMPVAANAGRPVTVWIRVRDPSRATA